MHWWDTTSGMGWWMIFGGLWMIIIWGGIIALVVWGITKLVRGSSSSQKNAIDIARERYARGEITREQFEEIKKDL